MAAKTPWDVATIEEVPEVPVNWWDDYIKVPSEVEMFVEYIFDKQTVADYREFMHSGPGRIQDLEINRERIYY